MNKLLKEILMFTTLAALVTLIVYGTDKATNWLDNIEKVGLASMGFITMLALLLIGEKFTSLLKENQLRYLIIKSYSEGKNLAVGQVVFEDVIGYLVITEIGTNIKAYDMIGLQYNLDIKRVRPLKDNEYANFAKERAYMQSEHDRLVRINKQNEKMFERAKLGDQK